MQQAILFVGFQNWGKSTLFRELFGNPAVPIVNFTQRIYNIQGIAGIDFWIKHNSNDDPSPGKGQRHQWLLDLSKHCQKAPNHCHFVSALCPSMEPRNNFITLLQDRFFRQFKKIDLIFIQYKWEGHAELLVSEIVKTIKGSPLQLSTHIITAHDFGNPRNDLLLKVSAAKTLIQDIV